MSNRFQPQAAALGLAATLTAAVLGGLAAVADSQYRSAADAHALLAQGLAQNTAQAGPQQIVVTGHRLQQIVVTGHRRG
jgi:hypothetical protein